jgi:hypothetical protein
MKYEVQQDTICDGWVNTWHEYDDDNNEVPMLFDSVKEAKLELKSHLYDMRKAYQMGDISEPYAADEFRIVEIENA